MSQPDLFTIQAGSVDQLPIPAMSYADATLNYKQYKEQVRRGLGMFSEDDEPQFSTVTECSLPRSAGITQIVEQYGYKREVNFTLYGLEEHKDAGSLVNWWLEQKDYKNGGLNKENAAGKWILANAKEMNTARRYWDAVRKHYDVVRLEDQIEQLQERLQVERLTLSVKVREAAEDRNFTVPEKQLLLKELGAQDKDLK